MFRRFRDTASFSLKRAHFTNSLHSTLNLEVFYCTVSPKFCKQRALSLDTELIIRVKRFPQDLTVSYNIHPLQTDKRQTTDTS